MKINRCVYYYWDNVFTNMLYHGHLQYVVMARAIIYIRDEQTIAMDQIWSTTWFCKWIFIGTNLHIVYDCFLTTTAELSSLDSNLKSTDPKTFIVWHFTKKVYWTLVYILLWGIQRVFTRTTSFIPHCSVRENRLYYSSQCIDMSVVLFKVKLLSKVILNFREEEMKFEFRSLDLKSGVL